MKRNKGRKIVALGLVLIMVFAALPTYALAQGTQIDDAQKTDVPVEGAGVADESQQENGGVEEEAADPPLQDDAAAGIPQEEESDAVATLSPPQQAEPAEDQAEEADNAITSFGAYGDVLSVAYGTDKNGIPFPVLWANNGEVELVGVTWSCGTYDGNTPGEYDFTAVLPDEYTLAGGVAPPVITVSVTNLPATVLYAVAEAVIMPLATDIPLTSDYFGYSLIDALTPYDTDGNSALSPLEIANVTSLVLDDVLELPMGLEHLTSLTSLTCNLHRLEGTDFAGYSGAAFLLEQMGQTDFPGTPLTYDPETQWITSTDKTYTQYSFLYGNISTTLVFTYLQAEQEYFFPDYIGNLPVDTGKTLSIDPGGYKFVDFSYDEKYVTLLNGSAQGVKRISGPTNFTVYGLAPTDGVEDAEYATSDAVVIRVTFSGNGLPEKTYGLYVKVTGDPQKEYAINAAADITSSHKAARAGETVTLSVPSIARQHWSITRTDDPAGFIPLQFLNGTNINHHTVTFRMPPCDIDVIIIMDVFREKEPEIESDPVADAIKQMQQQDQHTNIIGDNSDSSQITISIDIAKDDMKNAWDEVWENADWSIVFQILITYLDNEDDSKGFESWDTALVWEPKEDMDEGEKNLAEKIVDLGREVIGKFYDGFKNMFTSAQVMPVDAGVVELLSAAGVSPEFTLLAEGDDDETAAQAEEVSPVDYADYAASWATLPLAAPLLLFGNLFELPDTLADGGEWGDSDSAAQSTSGSSTSDANAEDIDMGALVSARIDALFDGLDTKDENGLYGGRFATEEETLAYIEDVKTPFLEMLEGYATIYGDMTAMGAPVGNELLAKAGVGAMDEEGWAMLEEPGIMEGISSHEITEEQMCLILYRAAGSPSVDSKQADAAIPDDVSDNARDAVLWCLQNDIIGADKEFAPQSAMTCIDASVYLTLFFDTVDPGWVQPWLEESRPVSIPAFEGWINADGTVKTSATA